MDWIALTDLTKLSEIKAAPGYSLIYKHSTRCSISMMVKRRVEQDWDHLRENIPVYYLDLIAYREVSNAIAEIFQVHHESPQLLLILNGECIYESSHGEISVEDAMVHVS